MKTLNRFLASITVCLLVIALGIPIGAAAKGSFAQDSGNVSIVEPTPTKPTDKPVAFAVSVSPIKAFRAPKGDQILANGNQYFITLEAPIPVEAVLVMTEGDHKQWIVVRKVSGGKSVKLTPYKKNEFLFEHSGPGEYEVTSLDEKSEPVFDYFEVETEGDQPDEPDKPTDPKPPTGDYSELIKIAEANANKDLETRKKLGSAWLAAIASLPPTATIAEVKQKIGSARSDVLSSVRDQDGSWNKYLQAIDGWFKPKNLDAKEYQAAMKSLAEWMTK